MNQAGVSREPSSQPMPARTRVDLVADVIVLSHDRELLRELREQIQEDPRVPHTPKPGRHPRLLLPFAAVSVVIYYYSYHLVFYLLSPLPSSINPSTSCIPPFWPSWPSSPPNVDANHLSQPLSRSPPEHALSPLGCDPKWRNSCVPRSSAPPSKSRAGMGKNNVIRASEGHSVG